MLAYAPMEKKKIEAKINKLRSFQIDPDGAFKKSWDIAIVILLIYTATYSPFRTAFMDETYSQVFFVFELCVDSLFFFDIIFSFLSPY
mmetsp:Transcript_28324/g.42881  ORF Transcript_28324/g.42881 Transcript_28324/m.42881 type:complete len:88 (-) Transcript_28324:1483-1746(-)